MNMEKVCQWLRRKRTACMGIFVQQDSIYMALTEWTEAGGQRLLWHEETVRLAGEEEKDFWERAAVRGMQNIYGDTVCYLVLEGQEVFYYEKEFPELSVKEMAQGVKLDFAAASGWHKSYALSWERLGNGRLVRIGGILRESLKEKAAFWKSYFTIEGGVLFCPSDREQRKRTAGALAVCEDGTDRMNNLSPLDSLHGLNGRNSLDELDRADGMQGAVYGAIAGLEQSGVRFCFRSGFLYKWDWLRCSAVLWGMSLLFGVAAGIWLGSEFYGNEQELHRYRERLSLLSDVRERKNLIEENQKIIERKNQMLGRIHENGLAGRGLMVHAGKIMTEGIWLTGLSAEAGHKLVMSGKAEGYGQVSRLMEDLQRDGDFFQGKVYLASAGIGRDGMIDFQLNGKL